MNKKFWLFSLHRMWGVGLALLLTLSAAPLFAQDDMEEGAVAEAQNCKPADLSTPYDASQSDTISQKQINIWYSFGSEEFKHEQYKRAVPYFWKVVINDKDGTFKVVYSKIATCYFELAKGEENQTAYLDSTLIAVYRGLEKYPDYVTLHYRAGSIFSTMGKTQCAIPHYEALVAANPQEVSYLKALAGLLFQIQDERCIQYQKKVVELQPDDAEANNLLIQMYQSFGFDPIDPIRDAFLNDTTNVANAMRYGNEAFIIGQYKEALRAANAAIKKEPNNVAALELKAKSYEALDNTSEAISTYREVLKIDPKNTAVLCNIARNYLRLNNFAQAQAQVGQAKRVDPNNGEPYMVMAEIYIAAAEYCSNKRGENKYNLDDKLVFEKAVEELKKAERDPNYRAAANTRRNGLKDFVRTKEDIFMNPRTSIKDECYSWIQ